MLEELKAGSRVVGAKQTRRALKDGRAKRVYMAKDADPRLLQPLVQEACKEKIERDRRRGAGGGAAARPPHPGGHHAPAGRGLRHLRGRRHRGGGMTPYFWF